MNEIQIYDSIKKGNVSTYLLYGDEKYQIDMALKIAKESLNPAYSDFNYTVVDLDYDRDIQGLINKCESVPFMDSKRVIVVKSSDLFYSATAYKKSDIEFLEQYIKNLPLFTMLIFVPSKLDKRNSAYKKIGKNCEVYEFSGLDKAGLMNFVSKKFSDKNVKIDSSAREFFVENSGYLFRDSEISLFDVENEIDKVLSNIEGKNTVSVEDIKNTIFAEQDADIFKFIDTTFSGDAKKAYEMMNSVFDSGKSPVLILNLFARQISIMLKIHILLKNNISNAVIAKTLKLNPFVVKKYCRTLKRYNYNDILGLYNVCSDMDYRAKTGKIKDRICVEIMVGRICAGFGK